MEHPSGWNDEVIRQREFLRDRARAQCGQKVDATATLVVSAVANSTILFDALVVYDDTNAFTCKLPVAKTALDKPLGITLHHLHYDDYQPKTSIAVMRKGRIWIDAEKVNAPGDVVYVKFAEDGSAKFTGEKNDNRRLAGAVFLEKSDGSLTPIEVNFFGGVQ